MAGIRLIGVVEDFMALAAVDGAEVVGRWLC